MGGFIFVAHSGGIMLIPKTICMVIQTYFHLLRGLFYSFISRKSFYIFSILHILFRCKLSTFLFVDIDFFVWLYVEERALVCLFVSN